MILCNINTALGSVTTNICIRPEHSVDRLTMMVSKKKKFKSRLIEDCR